MTAPIQEPVASTQPAAATGAGDAPPPALQPDPELGPLLVEPDEAKVAKKLEYYWAADDKRMEKRKMVWRRNRLWTEGVRNVYLTASENDETFSVYAPPASNLAPPVPNYTRRLGRRVTAQLTVDPAQPEVTAASEDESDVAAAEFATRILTVENSESGANFRRKTEQASIMAHDYGSAFAYNCLDPFGGGWEPKDIWAHPNAVQWDESDPALATTDPEPPKIPPDPAMVPQIAAQLQAQGFPPEQAMQQASMPQKNPKFIGPTNDLVKKYCMADGSLSEKPAGAEKRWRPKNKWMLMPGANVRFVPHTVTQGIDDADGCVFCIPTTLGELKSKFEGVASMDQETLRKLATYRPPKFKELGTDNRYANVQLKVNEKDELEDDVVCYPLTLYFKSHRAYPQGAYIVTCADKVLHKEPWSRELEDGRLECLDLPVAQCKDIDVEGDPYGEGLTEMLGPLDEINAQIWIFLLEYMFRHGNPNVYIPVTSPVQPESLRKRDGTPIEVTSKEDMPVYEQIPQLPKTITDMALRVPEELNTESGLEQAAQGVSSSSVQSGKHAQQIIEQALVALGVMKRNLDDFTTRMWRIDLQFRRAFYTVPQRMYYEGEDGVWREKEWSRTDLMSAKDVRIARGTSTMMTAGAKQQLALQELQLGSITLEDYQRITAQGKSVQFGYKDHPQRQRIRRNVSKWREIGRSLSGTDAMQADPMQVQTQSRACFPLLPCDEEPLVAMIRVDELRREMGTSAFTDAPPDHRVGFIEAYMQARQAAGIQTVAEQMQAAQMQQQQQMAMQAQEQEGKRSMKQMDIDAKSQQEAQRQESQMATEQMRTLQAA